MKPQRLSTLEERIVELRAEIEAIIDARAAAVARDSPGVPVGVVRNLLTARAPACPCSQFLELGSEKRPVGQAQPQR
jgi:hypothetical protein